MATRTNNADVSRGIQTPAVLSLIPGGTASDGFAATERRSTHRYTNTDMWIQTDNPQTQSLKRPFMDSPVEFSDNGTAQVDADVGEQLVEELDAITEYDNSTQEDNE